MKYSTFPVELIGFILTIDETCLFRISVIIVLHSGLSFIAPLPSLFYLSRPCPAIHLLKLVKFYLYFSLSCHFCTFVVLHSFLSFVTLSNTYSFIFVVLVLPSIYPNFSSSFFSCSELNSPNILSSLFTPNISPISDC